jgi:hypothetical protein
VRYRDGIALAFPLLGARHGTGATDIFFRKIRRLGVGR